MGKGRQLFSNEYKALEGYLRDGRFEIDNNLIENAIRPTAVGRRRWLFIGHPQAGWRSAVIISLLLSCRRRGINPQSYLSDVLNRLPSTKITRSRNCCLPSGNLHRRTLLETRLWCWPVAGVTMKKTYTDKQGQYLAFIYYYNKIHGCSPVGGRAAAPLSSLSAFCASDDLNARSAASSSERPGKRGQSSC